MEKASAERVKQALVCGFLIPWSSKLGNPKVTALVLGEHVGLT